MTISHSTALTDLRALLTLVVLCGSATAWAGDWKRLPAIPDREGVAGAFAGVSGEALLVAGGANFPGKKPWEGGQKVWHDAIYALDRPDGQWKLAGKLPRPLGYGVSATHRGGVVCVGGSDARGHYADAFRLAWKEGKVVVTPLPSLPQPVANACGALVGDTLYVAGGQESPDAKQALKTAWRIDLAAAKPQWQEIEPWPGPGRILAVAAACGGEFWLVGGADLVGDGEKVSRRYLKDAYRYHPTRGWTRIADLPRPVVAAPSPAPSDEAGFFLLGGDNGSHVDFQPPERHPGFSRQILRFDLPTEKWKAAGELPAAHVTAPCVLWENRWIIPSGEVRPGVRSPDVWSWPRQPRD